MLQRCGHVASPSSRSSSRLRPAAVARIRYTDLTAPTCWLCDRDRGELCHIHDPKMRKYLVVKDGWIEVDEEKVEVAWSRPAERRR
jgi:hypothetical protein